MSQIDLSVVEEQLKKRQQSLHDVMVPAEHLRLSVDNIGEGKEKPYDILLNLPNKALKTSPLSVAQFAKCASMPANVFGKVYERSSYFEDVVNDMFQVEQKGKALRLRIQDNRVLSMMKGTKVIPVHHHEVLKRFEGEVGKLVVAGECKVDQWGITVDGGLSMSVSISGEPNDLALSSEEGDVLRRGFFITNNDLTNTAKNVPRTVARVVYLACTNGMVADRVADLTGLKYEDRKLGDDINTVWNGFASDVRVSWGIMDAMPDRVNRAKEIMVRQVPKVLTALFAEFKVPEELEGPVLKEFQGNGDVEQMSKWNFINRWTTAAKNCAAIRNREFLERVGGRLIGIPLEALDLVASTEPRQRGEYRRLQFLDN